MTYRTVHEQLKWRTCVTCQLIAHHALSEECEANDLLAELKTKLVCHHLCPGCHGTAPTCICTRGCRQLGHNL